MRTSTKMWIGVFLFARFFFPWPFFSRGHTRIFKSQLDTQFAICNDYRSGFSEFLICCSTKLESSKVRSIPIWLRKLISNLSFEIFHHSQQSAQWPHWICVQRSDIWSFYIVKLNSDLTFENFLKHTQCTAHRAHTVSHRCPHKVRANICDLKGSCESTRAVLEIIWILERALWIYEFKAPYNLAQMPSQRTCKRVVLKCICNLNGSYESTGAVLENICILERALRIYEFKAAYYLAQMQSQRTCNKAVSGYLMWKEPFIWLFSLWKEPYKSMNVVLIPSRTNALAKYVQTNCIRLPMYCEKSHINLWI